MARLTAKQKRFCDEYLIDLNATQAAIRAGYSPKAATALKMRICEKEKRKDQLIRENEKVEKYIAAMPDGTAKDIFEMVFLDGMTQKEVGESVGYTQSMVSKVIKDILKHSYFDYVIIILNLVKRQISTLSSLPREVHTKPRRDGLATGRSFAMQGEGY